MKISDIRTFRCWDGARSYGFVQVRTDEGIAGAGQPYLGGSHGVMPALVESLSPRLVGQDPTRIEWLLSRIREAPGPVAWAALSGIDHALWDIAGKAAGVPVYMLLGGRFRDRVRVYHAISGSVAEELAETALALRDEGYTAFKMTLPPAGWRSMAWNAVVRQSAGRLEALRNALGEDVDIVVDVDAALGEQVRAMQLVRALAPLRPMFIEDPLGSENVHTLSRLRDQVSVPLAAGRGLCGLSRFVELIDAGGADIVRPDLCVCGGILEAKKIAAVAEAGYVSVAPRNGLGLLSTAAGVHVAASIPNFAILEYRSDHSLPGARFVDEVWKPVKGYLPLPTRPGLGMELDLDAIAKSPPV